MSGILYKFGGTTLGMLYSELVKSTEVPIEFLDPLCAAVKLAIISQKPLNTRISICKNGIYIQDPSIIQGAQRWWHGEDRDQLHQLRLPILYFRGLELGFVPLNHLKVPGDALTYLNRLMIGGLKKLKTTYEASRKKGSMVINCLDDYIKILVTPYTKEDYQKQLDQIGRPTLFVIYNEFMKKWQERDLQMIITLFSFVDIKKGENYNNELANSIDHFIMAKDLEIDAMRPG